MRLQVQVTAKSGLNVRSGPGTNYRLVKTLPNGSITTTKGDRTTAGVKWYTLEDNTGYICASYVKVLKNLDQTTPGKTDTTTPTTSTSTTGSSAGLDAKILQMLYAQADKYSNEIDGSTRLFGCPFQFTPETDFRLNSKIKLGRKYLQNIVAESPLVYFVPGRPNYLPDLSDSERKSLTSFFTGQKQDTDTKTTLDEVLGNEDIRYFDFVTDYSEYIRYVNLLCRVTAIYIGIGEQDVPGTTTKYKLYDWGNYKYKNDYKPPTETNKSVFSPKSIANDLYESMFGKYKYVQFYVEPNTSFSESAGNNTTSSKLEGMFDSAEGIIKELSFLTNTAAVKNLDEAKSAFGQNLDDIAQKMLKNSKENFFTRLLSMSSTVLQGSNIIFPEIWGDASYNKSYNVSINLISPYGDKESIYLNLLVPLMHLLALSMPRQSSANSYSSPFLVKAFSKGWFSCELGIIDSIQIDKGQGGDSWSADGLPLELKVSLGIKDLYSNLMVTSASKPSLFFQNQGLIDFLAVTCGLDVSKPNFLVKLESMMSIFFGKAVDLPGNLFRDFIQDIRNQIEPLFRM